MSQTELLKKDQIDTFMRKAVQDAYTGTLSFLREGKWNILDIRIIAADQSELNLRVMSELTEDLVIKKDQPVGICFQHEHHKYIFESTVTAFPGSEHPLVMSVDCPESIEKMQRRAYERHPIPHELNVRVMFWHRGYNHNSDCSPDEGYWQGKLENLSVGGAMIRVGLDHQHCFTVGQLVGVQFTPMSYQKPLLLEGQVRHLEIQNDQEDGLLVGVEFLGLEASPEGRDIIHRLLDIIEAYEKQNKADNRKDSSA